MCFLDPLKPDHPVNAGTQEISVFKVQFADFCFLLLFYICFDWLDKFMFVFFMFVWVLFVF